MAPGITTVSQNTPQAAQLEDWYHYENLLDSKKRDQLSKCPGDDRMSVFHHGRDFIGINVDEAYSVSASGSMAPNPGRLTLGKFHLSIASEDVAKAWNLIAPEIIKKRLLVKVVTPQGLQQTALPSARDKNVVIYFDKSNVGEGNGWQEFLNYLESTFKEAGIRPGRVIDSDRQIPGSRYIYMRYGETEYDKTTGAAVNAWDDGASFIPEAVRKMLTGLRIDSSTHAQTVSDNSQKRTTEI